MKLFNEFKSDQSGNVGLMFSVSLVAIVSAVGAAMDYGQMTKAQDVLQNQVDAGVLAASAASMEDWDIAPAQENAKRKEIALKVMSSNGFDMAGVEPTVFVTENGTVYGRAELDYKFAFGGLIGRESMNLVAESESGLGVGRPVHMALVLDNTLSMLPNGKMAALKTGAKDLIGAVEASGSGTKLPSCPLRDISG